MAAELTRQDVERNQAAWPNLRVDLDAFAAFLDGKRAATATPEETADALAVEDLYLAFACSRGDGKALAAFDREMRKDLEAAFAKLLVPPDRRDDVRQQLWE